MKILAASFVSAVRWVAPAVVLLAAGCANTTPHPASAAGSSALDYYASECDANDASACAHAGHVLSEPGWKAHDDARAVGYMTRACNVNAYYCGDLGTMYLEGKGVQRDESRGLSLIDRGCAAKNTSACGVGQDSRKEAQAAADKAKADEEQKAQARAQAELAAQAAQAQAAAKDAAPVKKPNLKKKQAKKAAQ
jgi:TPR repeat protein